METSTERLIHDIVHLSSPEFEGRLSETKGAEEAATFQASSLHSIGIAPFGDNDYVSAVPVQAS